MKIIDGKPEYKGAADVIVKVVRLRFLYWFVISLVIENLSCLTWLDIGQERRFLLVMERFHSLLLPPGATHSVDLHLLGTVEQKLQDLCSGSEERYWWRNLVANATRRTWLKKNSKYHPWFAIYRSTSQAWLFFLDRKMKEARLSKKRPLKSWTSKSIALMCALTIGTSEKNTQST